MKSLTLAIAFLALIGLFICHLHSKVSISEECSIPFETYRYDYLYFYMAMHINNLTLVNDALERQYNDLESIKINCQSDFSSVCLYYLENHYDTELRYYSAIIDGDYETASEVKNELDEYDTKVYNSCILPFSELSLKNPSFLHSKN